MDTTYVDEAGAERCDDCEQIVDNCYCVCWCGDSVHECACDEENGDA